VNGATHATRRQCFAVVGGVAAVPVVGAGGAVVVVVGGAGIAV
jgi:hypothetical protein